MDRINYKERDNYLIPDLQAEPLPEFGKYGRMRLSYLERPEKEAKLILLNMRGELNQHLVETEALAQKRVKQYLEELMKENPGPDKNQYPMEWAGHMNNLKHQAEELMYPEVIYR